MRGILDLIDDGVMHAAQSITDLAGPPLGIDNWSIARGALRTGAFFILIAVALLMSNISENSLLWRVILTFALILVSVAWFFTYLTYMDKLSAQQRSADAGRALRVSEKRTRRVDLLMSTIIIAIQLPDIGIDNGMLIAGILLFHVHHYFKAADMPPPSDELQPFRT